MWRGRSGQLLEGKQGAEVLDCVITGLLAPLLHFIHLATGEKYWQSNRMWPGSEMVDTLILYFHVHILVSFVYVGVWESWFPLRCYLLHMHGLVPVCLCTGCMLVACNWTHNCHIPKYILLDMSWPLLSVCPSAANKPLWAELEVLLPPIRLGQLWYCIWGWTTAYQEDLLGGVWFSVPEGEGSLIYFTFENRT